jgi:CDP-diacylglycerol--glycerol-3-phosphate 3-phosphatidyltransferase
MATVTPRRPHVFNLPNQLTAARFVLAVILFGLIRVEAWAWCLAVFVVAAFTDWLDGYLARVNKQTSTLGRNLDPLVDKVLMCGAYIFLLPKGMAEGEGWLQPWMVTVVVARELVITSLRSYLESFGASFGADWLGKVKMGLQCAAVIAIFVVLLIPGELEGLKRLCGVARDGMIYAMLAATLLSGLQYLWKAAALLNSDAAGS